MFQTKKVNYKLSNISNTNYISFDIPTKCPNCNAFIHPSIIDHKCLNFSKDTSLLIITYQGECCKNPFDATYSYSSCKANLLDVYRHLEPATLSSKVKELSPRFAKLYNQSYTAEQNGSFELAGSGYRNSIEILIKDFAIKKLQAPEDEVCKMSLYDAIGTYLNEVNINTSSADVIRVLGNDYTHYQRHYDDIDFVVVKKYLDIFIQQIETKLLIMEPIIPVIRQN